MAEGDGGERQVVFVSGEPGIGKTRLVSELAELVRSENGSVLTGRCDEEALIVYQPFIEALRSHFDQSPDDFSDTRGQPVGFRLGAPLAGAEHPPAFAGNAASEATPKQNATVCSRPWLRSSPTVSESRPTLLILDDLQWADRASLLLLKHVIRSPRKARLLLLGTYRDTDLRRGHPLTDLLADLRRDRAFQRTALTGLT